jgi:hypothetical protein
MVGTAASVARTPIYKMCPQLAGSVKELPLINMRHEMSHSAPNFDALALEAALWRSRSFPT